MKEMTFKETGKGKKDRKRTEERKTGGMKETTFEETGKGKKDRKKQKKGRMKETAKDKDVARPAYTELTEG